MDADFTLPAWSWGMTNKGHITPRLKAPAVIIAAMILHYNWRKQRWYWDQHVYEVEYNEQKKVCNNKQEPNVNRILICACCLLCGGVAVTHVRFCEVVQFISEGRFTQFHAEVSEACVVRWTLSYSLAFALCRRCNSLFFLSGPERVKDANAPVGAWSPWPR